MALLSTRIRTPLLLCMVFLPASLQSQEVDPERYAQVKAGYVLNLVRLTQWPRSAFLADDDPIAIQVVGNDAMTRYLRELVRHERIEGRAIVLRQMEFHAERGRPRPSEVRAQLEPALERTHVLYIARSESARLQSIVTTAARYPVLTVSDIPGFAVRRGGMIGLALRDGRVGLDANTLELDRSAVSVSSRVLHLANVVPERQQVNR